MVPVQPASLLAIGAVIGAVIVGIAFALPRFTRQLLVFGIVVAAAFYVYFAVDARAGAFWLLVEVAGVGLYGAIGLIGLVGSAWWLVAGWALHPVWDLLLHYFGPGAAFAPTWYTIPCLSIDWFVAAYIAYRIARGWAPAG